MCKTKSLLAGCVLSLFAIVTTTAQASHGGVMYEVTVTNLTQGQPLAPILAVTHSPWVSIFEEGQAPSDGLAWLAEAGNGQPMADELAGMPGISDVQLGTTGPTMPGQSATVMISANWGASDISVAAMLGATNDAFYAIKNMRLPRGWRSVTYMASAYDAGSETNDELASTVAGLGGEAYSPNDSGEGFVHIHPGVHGIGDLNAATMDWRNPVAKIVIKRVKGN